MPSRIWRNILGAIVVLTLLTGFGFTDRARAEGDKAQVKAGAPKAHWTERRFEFAPLLEGTDVTHDFFVENKGNAPLEILKVQPG